MSVKIARQNLIFYFFSLMLVKTQVEGKLQIPHLEKLQADTCNKQGITGMFQQCYFTLGKQSAVDIIDPVYFI